MRLAIVSTTFLFTMMAAQAAVLSATSATSTTGVNLVKRAPTNGGPLSKHENEEIQRLCEELRSKMSQLIGPAFDKDDEIKALITFIEDLEKRRKGKTQAERTSINAAIAIFETELAEFNNQLSKMKAGRELYGDRYRDINQAIYDNNFGYLREKYLNPQ
ncbi:hypothetical protein BASA81_006252 [Batrachochytrium salamandrivorans]|nr:hypothetical protein BASA81_006252 [Batrachochytrium salamandrivorans]